MNRSPLESVSHHTTRVLSGSGGMYLAIALIIGWLAYGYCVGSRTGGSSF